MPSTASRRKRPRRGLTLDDVRTKLTPSEQLLEEMLRQHLPAPRCEVLFHPLRRWRFDFAWHDRMIAAEVEGGIFIRGRHASPAGFIKDAEKYNTAALLGWRVFRFPVHGGRKWIDEAIPVIKQALAP